MALFVRLRDGIGDFFLVAGGRLRISCYEMSNQRAAKQTSLLAFADGGALVKRVVSAGLDGVEDGEAAATEHIEIDAESRVHHFRERRAFGEQCPRAGNQIFHQIYVAVVEAAVDDVRLGEAVSGSGVEGNIDAPLFEVARDVLPEVGKLQGGADGVGEELAALIAIAAEIQDKAADRIGGIG